MKPRGEGDCGHDRLRHGCGQVRCAVLFHYDISGSIDAYYQEIGRGDRDGNPAKAILCYRLEDLSLHRFFSGTGRVGAEQVKHVAEALKTREGPVAPEDLREKLPLSQAKLSTPLRGLEDTGGASGGGTTGGGTMGGSTGGGTTGGSSGGGTGGGGR